MVKGREETIPAVIVSTTEKSDGFGFSRRAFRVQIHNESIHHRLSKRGESSTSQDSLPVFGTNFRRGGPVCVPGKTACSKIRRTASATDCMGLHSPRLSKTGCQKRDWLRVEQSKNKGNLLRYEVPVPVFSQHLYETCNNQKQGFFVTRIMPS